MKTKAEKQPMTQRSKERLKMYKQGRFAVYMYDSNNTRVLVCDRIKTRESANTVAQMVTRGTWSPSIPAGTTAEVETRTI